ncbi:MAG: S1C family serine protease, partial [Opitutales bacterium]
VQGQGSRFYNKLFPTRMLRASVPVGPGEVGAPMLDLDGRFIGMVFASFPDLRSSCILPASAVQRIRDDLFFSGKVSYAWFGLTVKIVITVEEGYRVVVDQIFEGSPAASSTIQKGDQLLKIEDHVINHRGDVAHAAFFARPGRFINFLVRRGKEEFEIPIRVSGKPPVKTPPEPTVPELEVPPVHVEQNATVTPVEPNPSNTESKPSSEAP